MPLKLYYWSFKARSEQIKTLLHYLKVDFEEINPTKEEWPALQNTFIDGGFNFPNLPMIEDGDYKLSESMAIMSYIAEAYGDGSLAGKNPQDQAIVRQLEGVLRDLVNIFLKCVFTPEFKSKLQEAAGDEKLLKVVRRLENQFSDGRHFALGYFTIADLFIANTYRLVNHFMKSAGVDNPMEKKILYEHAIRVANLPGIKEYFESNEYKNTPYFRMPWFKEHPLTAPAN